MEVKFSSASHREVLDAARFFESEVDGLGKAFLIKLKEGIHEIKRNPYASRIIRGDFRRQLLSRFPYGIIFRIDENCIFIAAVMHLKRKPDYWEHR
jgi:toxin ParE1/3/4